MYGMSDAVRLAIFTLQFACVLIGILIAMQLLVMDDANASLNVTSLVDERGVRPSTLRNTRSAIVPRRSCIKCSPRGRD
jgi:hypothetical protein